MDRRWMTLCLLGLWAGGCAKPPEPADVRKVEECVRLLQADVNGRDAKAGARNLIEASALLEEAVQAACGCYKRLPADNRYRELVVDEIVDWLKTWDSEGRPVYLAQFYGCFGDTSTPGLRLARELSASAYAERLERTDKDESAGLRALHLLQSKALEDQSFCVQVRGTAPGGKQPSGQKLLELFEMKNKVNPWSASGLELSVEAREGCPAELRIELAEMVTVLIQRDGETLFERQYTADAAGGQALATDFRIP
jgi:hypothetical protein